MTPEESIQFIRDLDSKKFAEVQRSSNQLAGFIASAWHTPTLEYQGYYWHESGSGLGKFGSSTSSEAPKIYVSKRALLKRLQSMKKDYPKKFISVVWWTHPDAQTTPLSKYMKMERPFPGCPTQ